ncbi:MAG: AAA family ATPase [Candidatus Tectomicrobia bacterium]|nr:AAA family ATPase [Candidatus Tectomicrobia bacterium]
MEQQTTIKAETPKELAPDQLRWTCPTEIFPFTTTAEIVACSEVIGQARALRALQLGLEVKSSGYNIFVTGLVGTGRTSTIKQILESLRGDERVPDDHLFVYNFKDPDQPCHLRLPAGQGRRLKKQMEGLISTLKERLPQIFESDAYQQRKKEIVEEIRQQEKDLIKQFEQKVNEKNFALIQVQMGPLTRPGVFPIVQGNPTPLNQVEALVDKGEFPRERFELMQKEHDALTEELQNIHKKLRALEQQLQSSVEDLESRTAKPYAAGLIQEIKETFRNERLHEYLDEVLENIVKGLDRFGESSAGQAPQMVPIQGMMLPQPRDPFIDFQVNLVVDNAEARRPPVVVENHPSYRNLFGTIERVFEHAGAWATDFTHIKAGALLRANGGYLVINALDALLELGVWPALKRTLRTRFLEIQNLDGFSVLGASAMKPEPIPIDLKVVMIGDERLYHLLTNFEEDFSKIFKVKADFDSVTDRDDETLHKYACFVKKIGEEEHLLPFDRSGVATVVEAAVRHAGRQRKISTQFSKVADVVREASYWAAREKQTVVSRPYVEQAIRERILRVNLIEEKIQELIEEGTLFIDTEGVALGQVNGLAVLSLGDYAFGKPSRITATVSMGRAGIINIEPRSTPSFRPSPAYPCDRISR